MSNWFSGSISDLFARFNVAALRPPATLSRPEDWQAPGPSESITWKSLRQWCFAYTSIRGGGQDESWPSRQQQFSVALLSMGRGSDRSHLVESLCQELDGSVQLAACRNGVDRLRLRLRVKLLDVLPWRTPHVSDPWDCGYASEDVEAIESLQRFSPRRATLIVVPSLPPTVLIACVEAFVQKLKTFRHPVRMLIISEDENPATAESLRRRIELTGAPAILISMDASAG